MKKNILISNILPLNRVAKLLDNKKVFGPVK